MRVANTKRCVPIQFHLMLPFGGVPDLEGINKWGSIVGSYVTPDFLRHGFKRWSNGGIITLDFPGTTGPTQPFGINDNGVVVGS